jgi:hypothetical protein
VERVLVPGARALGEVRRAGLRDDGVVLEGDDEERAGDALEARGAAGEREGAAGERVAAVEVLDPRAPALPGEAHVVATPRLQRQEAVEELVVVGAVDQRHHLREVHRRPEHVKARLQELPRHVAQRVHHGAWLERR